MADLDTRGSPRTWLAPLNYCEGCGYCAMRLDLGGEQERCWVASDSYQLQLSHPDFPRAANRYLCMDLIAQARQQWADSCWYCIQAAWVCDDRGDTESARQCRLWAINRMGQAQASGQAVTSQPGSELLLRLDLLRRAQRFNQAERLLDRGVRTMTEPMLERIFRYQRLLIAQRNDRRHNLADMERWERSGGQ